MLFWTWLRWNRHIPCMQCEREIAYFESLPSAHAQTFPLLRYKGYHSLYFPPFVSGSKTKIVSQWLILLYIFFPKFLFL